MNKCLKAIIELSTTLSRAADQERPPSESDARRLAKQLADEHKLFEPDRQILFVAAAELTAPLVESDESRLSGIKRKGSSSWQQGSDPDIEKLPQDPDSQKRREAKHLAISTILHVPPERALLTENFEHLRTLVLEEMVSSQRVTSDSDDEREARCIALVELVVAAPQASKHQEFAFSELLPLILPIIDHHSRRPYLPKDESDWAAIETLSRVRNKNFQSLRQFLETRRTHPSQRLTNWLRRMCGWAISKRLGTLLKTGLLAGDENAVMAVEEEDSTTGILNRLINAETDAVHNLYAQVELGLSELQRRSLTIYLAMREGTLPDEFPKHERKRYKSLARKLGARERTNAAYAQISATLSLPNARNAERLVMSAKQRLRTALELLAKQEAAISQGERAHEGRLERVPGDRRGERTSRPKKGKS
ncbi:MAG TPA: hypothetical protein VNO30_30775 [Kofleriaceae bacterium]|nr:hypothetical protein [Kofleriaceae bacterium]